MMVESEVKELSEAQMLEALSLAHKGMQPVIDAIIDPLVGQFSDNLRTKLGIASTHLRPAGEESTAGTAVQQRHSGPSLQLLQPPLDSGLDDDLEAAA